MTNDQDTDHRNDMTLLTPLLLMALVVVCGFLFFGISPPANAPEQHASATATAAQH